MGLLIFTTNNFSKGIVRMICRKSLILLLLPVCIFFFLPYAPPLSEALAVLLPLQYSSCICQLRKFALGKWIAEVPAVSVPICSSF